MEPVSTPTSMSSATASTAVAASAASIASKTYSEASEDSIILEPESSTITDTATFTSI